MSATSISVRNPLTGERDYAFTPPSTAELGAICERLRAGQAAWRAAGVDGRVEALLAWRAAIAARRDALIDAVTHDTGRRAESVMEVDLTLGAIERWCRQAPALLDEGGEQATSIPFLHWKRHLVPYTLVGVISPWNFPLLLATIDLIPALLAGCAAIVKPSEITPRFVEPLSASVAEVPLLCDALNFVPGAGETGAAIVERVDLICFTGSVATGRRVAEAAARAFIPAFLELGGKDAAIVLDGSDLEAATAAILWGATVNCGHSCLSIERVYVERPAFDAFVARIVERARGVGLTHEGGPIGPIIAERQAAIIGRHLDDAIARGATVHCGGQVEEHGGALWCRPTVLTGVDHEMLIMREETFGPIVPIMAVDDAEHAITLANDSIFGLSGSVFAPTLDAAERVARGLEAGAISLNDAALTAVMHEGEKQAFKASGLGGTRMGPSAISRFMRRQALIGKRGEGRDPWWFT